MRSLLAALVLGLVLSLAAMYAVQRAVVGATLQTVMTDYIAGELAQDADELRAGLTALPGQPISLAIAHFDPAFLSPASGRYFQIMAGATPLIRSPSLSGLTLAAAPQQPGQRTVAVITGPLQRATLLSASGYAFEGRPVTIVVATDMRPVASALAQLTARHARASLLMFALLLAVQVAIVRWALSPLARVRADVGRLERGEIDQLGERVPAEVLPLVRELNRLLALLTRRLQRSREALGNLAHALKTPLAVLTHMAEQDRSRQDPVLGDAMLQQLQLLRNRIDSELRRARVAGGGGHAATIDLAAEMTALATTLRMLYRERQLAVRCEAQEGLQLQCDREDVLELAGNLLDNACKWARSQVLLRVYRDGPAGAVVLQVEDDGPGCPEADLARLARRGVRLDEATAGHGLGLAIAAGIAASYDTAITFGRSPTLGGFMAAVRFPVPHG